VEVAINTGCVLFKEGDYEGAAAKFNEAAAMEGSQVWQPEGRVCQIVVCTHNSSGCAHLHPAPILCVQ
jgi:hypothetical protein